MNAKAVLTFTFLVLFDNYAVIGESFVEYAKHNYKITTKSLTSLWEILLFTQFELIFALKGCPKCCYLIVDTFSMSFIVFFLKIAFDFDYFL